MQNSMVGFRADAILTGGFRKRILRTMMTMHPSCEFETFGPRQIIPSVQLIALSLLSGAALLMGSAAAHAESLSVGPAKVNGLVIDGLRGSIIVDVSEVEEVELTIDGDQEALDRLETTVDDDAIRIKVPSSDTNIAVIEDNVTVIASGGGTSRVQIGDKVYTNDSEPIELDVRATVPPGTILRLGGLVGSVEIGDTEADVVLSCASCEATMGTIAALDLNIAGSGEVAVEAIDRALVAEISGGGSIDIADGDVDSARVNIVGSGDVGFGGHAVDASVNIVGSGKVHIRETDNPIQSTIIGSGDVVTGN
jgi:hypothetical protein